MRKLFLRKIIQGMILPMVLTAAYLATNTQKMYLSAIFLSIALLAAIFAIRRTLPLFVSALICFWVAIMHEVWGGSAPFNYTDFTRFLWSAGNILLGVGFVEFAITEWINNIKNKENGNKQ